MNLLANAIEAIDEETEKWKVLRPGLQIHTKVMVFQREASAVWGRPQVDELSWQQRSLPAVVLESSPDLAEVLHLSPSIRPRSLVSYSCIYPTIQIALP